jgi:SAM-dependent methyltransferase
MMHQAARDWIDKARANLSVCELGSYDVNGGIRDLFPGWSYVGVDSRPGKGVHVVADAATWDGDGRKFDVVVCCEVFEHCPTWMQVCRNAYRLLKPGGWFFVTAAGPGRQAHSCDAALMVEPYPEWYGNVDPRELEDRLDEVGFTSVLVNVQTDDVRASARKPFGSPGPLKD